MIKSRALTALLMLALWMLLILWLTPSQAATYYVATTGNNLAAGGTSTPWQTLGKATSTVVAGDTVIVRSGTYAEVFNETTDGTAGAKITYQSEVKWGAKIRPTVQSGNAVVSLSGDHLVFDGFEVDGSGVVNAFLGVYSGGGFNTVKNNHIHNIHNNVPSPCSGTGAGALHSGNDSTGQGLFDSNVVHDVGIPGCNFDHTVYSDSPGNTWNNNIIYKSNSVGMHMYGSTGETITNNTVFNNAGSGILIASPTCCNNNNLVRNNISVFNGGRGIIEESNTGANNVYTHNLLFGNAVNCDLNTGSCTNTVTANPLFVNYQPDGSGDYHLSSSSPAIGTGTATNAPNHDYDGLTRPQDGTFDIGAFEFVGADPLPPGLVAHWKFDEVSGTSAADSSGSGKTGTLTNGAAFNPGGVIGGAVALDGTNDYVDLGTSTVGDLITGATASTVSAWVKYSALSATDSFRNLIFSGLRGGGGANVYLNVRGDTGNVGKVLAGGRSGSESFLSNTGTVVIPANEWTHVAAVLNYTGDTIAIYVNGVLDNTASAAFVSDTYVHGVPTVTDRIGDYDGTAGYPFRGMIDDVRLFNTARTAATIRALYDQVAGVALFPPRPVFRRGR